MKQIFGKTLYDTEKAELILEYKSKRLTETIFGQMIIWIPGKLYKTAKGNWFEVIGEKERLTMYQITEAAAKRIIMCDPDKYQELFGDLEEA